MAGRFKTGDTAYIIESNCFIREVEIQSCSGGMYLVKFKDNGGGIKLKEHRLFWSKEEAEASVNKPAKKTVQSSPYDKM